MTGVLMELCPACDGDRPAAAAFIWWHLDPDRDSDALPRLFEDWENETMHALGFEREPRLHGSQHGAKPSPPPHTAPTPKGGPRDAPAATAATAADAYGVPSTLPRRAGTPRTDAASEPDPN